MTGKMNNAQLRIGGEAGQGVILAGVILAQAAMNDGRRVAQSARYGAAVRGGEATADIVISDEAIDYPHVEEPDNLVVLSQPTYDRFVPGQRPGTTVFYDPFFITPAEPPQGVRQIEIAATDRAIKHFGKGTTANLILLGFICGSTSIVSKESLESAVEDGVSARFRKANLEALAMGYEMSSEVSHG